MPKTFQNSGVRSDELITDVPKRIQLAGKWLCLVRSQDQVYALEDSCPHQGESLAGGDVVDGCIRCPAHNWRFDLGSGDSPVVPDAFVYTFSVKIEDDMIWIRI